MMVIVMQWHQSDGERYCCAFLFLTTRLAHLSLVYAQLGMLMSCLSD